MANTVNFRNDHIKRVNGKAVWTHLEGVDKTALSKGDGMNVILPDIAVTYVRTPVMTMVEPLPSHSQIQIQIKTEHSEKHKGNQTRHIKHEINHHGAGQHVVHDSIFRH